MTHVIEMSRMIANSIVAVDDRHIRDSDTRADCSRVSSFHEMQALKLREMVTIRRSTEKIDFRQQASMTSIPHDAGE